MHLFSKEHLAASSGIVGAEGPVAPVLFVCKDDGWGITTKKENCDRRRF